MTDALALLRCARSIVVVDWPSPDVPESLVRAGREVFVKGGPGPRDFSVRELNGDQVIARPADQPPAHTDLLYAHRPAAELPALIELARGLGAQTIWWQSGLSGPDTRDPTGCWVPEDESQRSRRLVESAGLQYVDDVYIADAARDARVPG